MAMDFGPVGNKMMFSSCLFSHLRGPNKKPSDFSEALHL